jgi:hypothetical protein
MPPSPMLYKVFWKRDLLVGDDPWDFLTGETGETDKYCRLPPVSFHLSRGVIGGRYVTEGLA